MNKIILIAMALVFSATVHAADPAAGKEKAKACAACHGEGGAGMSAMQDFPKLAGQYNDYIVRALKDYRAGVRNNAVMADQAKNLKDADIADLAAWFSSQSALVAKQ